MKNQYLNTYSMLCVFYIIETYFDTLFLSKYIILYPILSDIIYSFSNFNIRKLDIRKLESIYFHLSIHIFSEGETWECGFSLTLHMCHGSLTALQPLTISVCFPAVAKQNQNQKPKNKQQNKKPKNKKIQDPTLCHYFPPWGVQSCFCFFGFLFFCQQRSRRFKTQF